MATTDELKTIARRVIEEIFSEGRHEVADEIISPDFIGYDAALPEPNRGIEGIKQSAAGYRAAFPDLTLSVDQQVAEGDTVVTRWTGRGTHEGDLFGIAPTGKQTTVTGISIDRIVDGKVVEDHTNWDTFGLMQQLGAIPSPTTA
jgi:predicted ester cyclase